MTKRGRMARDYEEPNQKAQETFVSWATGILNFFSSLRTVTVSQLLPLLARRREGCLFFFFIFSFGTAATSRVPLNPRGDGWFMVIFSHSGQQPLPLARKRNMGVIYVLFLFLFVFYSFFTQDNHHSPLSLTNARKGWLSPFFFFTRDSCHTTNTPSSSQTRSGLTFFLLFGFLFFFFFFLPPNLSELLLV